MHISEEVLGSRFGGGAVLMQEEVTVTVCINSNIYTDQSLNYVYQSHVHHPTEQAKTWKPGLSNQKEHLYLVNFEERKHTKNRRETYLS